MQSASKPRAGPWTRGERLVRDTKSSELPRNGGVKGQRLGHGVTLTPLPTSYLKTFVYWFILQRWGLNPGPVKVGQKDTHLSLTPTSWPRGLEAGGSEPQRRAGRPCPGRTQVGDPEEGRACGAEEASLSAAQPAQRWWA